MSTLQNHIYMCIFSSSLQMAIVIQQHIKPYAIYFGIGDQSQVVCFCQCLTYSHSILLMAVFFFCSPGRMSKSYQGHWQETIWGIIRVWHQCIQAKVSLLCQEWGRFGPVYNCWVTGTAKSIVLKTYYVWLFHNSMNERLLFRVIESNIRRSVGHLSRKAICFSKIDLNLMNKPNPCNTG